jgi:protein Tex
MPNATSSLSVETQLRITKAIAAELQCKPEQVTAAVGLLDEGATVPFISRYRKEATGGLDDTQMRNLEERLGYLREMEERRVAIVTSITEQGKMTDELALKLATANTKAELEDLYLPYKPKLRTKAQIAREAGIEPLALAVLADPTLVPTDEAAKFINADKGFADVKAVLDGAKQILMEKMAEDATLVGQLREHLHTQASVTSAVDAGKETEGAKFSDYFEFSETWKTIPSHRALAILRGRNESILKLEIQLPEDLETDKTKLHPCEARIAAKFAVSDQGRAADSWLMECVRWAWRIKLYPHLKLDLFNNMRERAENEAIKVFGSNLRDLLMASPAGPRATLGLDPGLRTGVKVAVVDTTGQLVSHTTIYPHEPRRDWDGSLAVLAALCEKFNVSLIAIGNGTASRETDKLAAELIQKYPELKMQKAVVSEAGASVYSASEFAAKEFPDLDVSIRGAVSIARRLQDPLAELVKIDPKSIGVGQYQHDVSQVGLAKTLDAIVEDCVNAVGVDVNTASIPLLARVSGLSSLTAANIVKHRDANGPFASREALRKVPRLGDKTFEQAAGFLRVMKGENPLDASAVHPEAYPLVQKILADIKKEAHMLIGDSGTIRSITPAKYADEKFGVPTITDILKELDKPGRDPRPEFKAAQFADGVHEMSDLKPDMILEGVVTNVAAFGAFVDIGVHQDGLVHVSQLSHKFVKDPREVVKAGQIVKVKVQEVDIPRKRIGLTMRLDEPAQPRGADNKFVPATKGQNNFARKDQRLDAKQDQRKPAAQGAMQSAMAAAFAKVRQ